MTSYKGSRTVALVAVLLVSACSCGDDDSSSSSGTGGTSGAAGSNGIAPCTSMYCADADAPCKHLADVCKVQPANYREGWVQGCKLTATKGIEDYAKANGKDVGQLTKEYLACLAKAAQCEDGKLCAPGTVAPATACAGDHGCEDKPETVVLPPSENPTHTGVPGDDPECLKCAEQKCVKELDTCSSDTKSCTKDCCWEYRGCLGECAITFGQGDVNLLLQCNGECGAKFPGGAQAYVPYANCMIQQCANCAKGTPGTGGSGGFGGAAPECGKAFANAACNSCLQQGCCFAMASCSNNPACTAFQTCMSSCTGSVSACAKKCTPSSKPEGFDALVGQLTACAASPLCADLCESTGTAGAGGAGGGGAGGAAGGSGGQCGITYTVPGCQPCGDLACCAQGKACAGEQQCLKLADCVNGCPSGDEPCQNDCATAWPKGVAPLQAWAGCLQTSCAQCFPLRAGPRRHGVEELSATRATSSGQVQTRC